MASGSPQNIYQYMKKFVVIVLIKIYQSKPSDKIIPDNICIIFWRNMCIVYIKEEIIKNLQFQYSGTLLVILSVSIKVSFGDNKEVSLIVT